MPARKARFGLALWVDKGWMSRKISKILNFFIDLPYITNIFFHKQDGRRAWGIFIIQTGSDFQR